MSAEIKMNELVAQMRVMAARTQAEPSVPTMPELNTADASKTSFDNVLSDAISKVNDLQKTAGAMTRAFEKGDNSVSLPEVMIATQKSSVAFEAVKEVRNKLVNAYQEIMNMPV